MHIFSRSDPLYDQNPLICGIDPILQDPSRLEKNISFLPPVPDDSERARSLEYRVRKTGVFPRLHVPLNRDFEVAAMLEELITEGYVDRAPNARYWERHAIELDAFLNAFRSGRPLVQADRCVGLMGISGIGKSRILKLLLGLIPRIIRHAFGIQLPFIYVECPSNRKPGSLAKKIIKAICDATGDNLETMLSGSEIEDFIVTAAALCRLHFVGLIVVDDIQNAVSRAKKPRTDIVDLLVELSNELNIPMLFVGTPKAVKFLGREMRSGRKILGNIWDRFAQSDEDWRALLEKLWQYQWNKTYTPLTAVLRKKIYELTQGVPAFLVRLLHFAQRRAIYLGGEERITDGILQETFDLNFGPVKPIVRALTSGNMALIALFEDLPKDFSLEDMLAREAEEFRKEESIALRRTIRNARKKAGQIARGRLALEATLATPSQDAVETTSAHLVVADAIKMGRDPIEALAAAGLIGTNLLSARRSARDG